MSDAPAAETLPEADPAPVAAAAPPAGPRFIVTPECENLLSLFGLPTVEAIEAFQRRDDAMVVPSVPMHLYAIRWFPSGDAIFTSGEITRMEWRGDRSVPAEIVLRMALRLRPRLPAGTIGPLRPIDVVWSRIADSFGLAVTCHKKAAPVTRFTGRWDGKAPQVEGAAADDRVIIDGGFERAGDSVKYVWALSTNKYLAWLDGTAQLPAQLAPAELAPGDIAGAPRVVFARMQPAKLSRQVVVRADIGEATVRVVCSRCSLVDIDDPPHFHPAMKCLHVFGAEILDDEIPQQLEGKEYVIPLHFVTDIRPGPSTFLTGEHAPQRSAVLPNDYRPGNRMSQKMIEMLLAELTG